MLVAATYSWMTATLPKFYNCDNLSDYEEFQPTAAILFLASLLGLTTKSIAGAIQFTGSHGLDMACKASHEPDDPPLVLSLQLVEGAAGCTALAWLQNQWDGCCCCSPPPILLLMW